MTLLIDCYRNLHVQTRMLQLNNLYLAMALRPAPIETKLYQRVPCGIHRDACFTLDITETAFSLETLFEWVSAFAMDAYFETRNAEGVVIDHVIVRSAEELNKVIYDTK